MELRYLQAVIAALVIVSSTASVRGKTVPSTVAGLQHHTFSKRIAQPKRIGYTLKADYHLYVPASSEGGGAGLLLYLHDNGQQPAVASSGPIGCAARNPLPLIVVAPVLPQDKEWSSGRMVETVEGILDEPNTMVLSRETADKFFAGEDPVGKFLEIDTIGAYEVVGIIAETRKKSHIQFEALISLSTLEFLDQQRDNPEFLNNWSTAYGSWI